MQLGVPADRIVLESGSVNTHDEAVLVAPMLRALHVDRLVVVTSDIHMRRSLATFRGAGLDPVPAIASDPLNSESRIRSFIPTTDGLRFTRWRGVHEADQGLGAWGLGAGAGGWGFAAGLGSGKTSNDFSCGPDEASAGPDAAERQAFVAAFERAIREIATVRNVRIGKRVVHGAGYEARVPDAADYIAVIDFDDLDGLQTYLRHPAHEELGRRFYEVLSSGLVFDFEMGGMETLEYWLREAKSHVVLRAGLPARRSRQSPGACPRRVSGQSASVT